MEQTAPSIERPTKSNDGNVTKEDSSDDLESKTKEELIQLVRELRGRRNVKPKRTNPSSEKMEIDGEETREKCQNEKKRKQFSMEKYSQRHIALKIVYFGWNLQGFAAQASTDNTVEAHLFNALMRTRLITSREECRYSRCGRTDKGVSAVSQVVSLVVRSNLPTDPSSSSGNQPQEINYLRTLNSSLPPEIRVIGWAPVPETFDARFSTQYRTYKYFFVKGSLDISAMRIAALKLVGEHDFRNFCKIDVVNVSNFLRKILSFSIDPVDPQQDHSSALYAFTICGTAFLWHQVRCMAAVLFLVGEGKEDPSVIEWLLDVGEEGKPNYSIASEIPLVLWDTGYDSLVWEDAGEASKVDLHFRNLWNDLRLKTAVISLTLSPEPPEERSPSQNSAKGKYIPLAKRQKQDPLSVLQQNLSGSKKTRNQKNLEKGKNNQNKEKK